MEVGEEKREDLKEFIKHADLGKSRKDKIKIPIKIIDLPEFVYSPRDKGGIGKGDVEEGQIVDMDEESEDDEPGDEEDKPGYKEFDPEEFAEKLDEELGLDLEPKGKKVKERKEGPITDLARTGPSTTLDFERLFRKGLKRKLALEFDEEYCRELLKVKNIGPKQAFSYADKNNINVSLDWFRQAYENIDEKELDKYKSLREFENKNQYTTVQESIRKHGIDSIPYRKEDERYKYPEIKEEKESQVVIINIRDVSGSMSKDKRELVERVFTPLDWYLQGKYDKAEFVYIAHNVEAWEVDREEFFGIKSGGGTKISSAYELTKEILNNNYSWSEWNRYVFCAGDGENKSDDSKNEVVPLMKEIKANKHAYLETSPNEGSVHGDVLKEEFEGEDDYVVSSINSKEDVINSIKKILSKQGDKDE